MTGLGAPDPSLGAERVSTPDPGQTCPSGPGACGSKSRTRYGLVPVGLPIVKFASTGSAIKRIEARNRITIKLPNVYLLTSVFNPNRPESSVCSLGHVLILYKRCSRSRSIPEYLEMR